MIPASYLFRTAYRQRFVDPDPAEIPPQPSEAERVRRQRDGFLAIVAAGLGLGQSVPILDLFSDDRRAHARRR